MEKEIIEIIEENGPLTGSELSSFSSTDSLLLLRSCRLSDQLTVKIMGNRYLRLDKRIDGYARLSPSILREFLTYSVVGLSRDRESLQLKAIEIKDRIEKISRSKCDLAYNIMSSVMSRMEYGSNEYVTFIIAGDIVFNMAHDIPRPERSTGKLVKGSDMDIVVIVKDEIPGHLMTRLDEEIFKEKYRLLINPYDREEIDYIVKNISRVREQIDFDSFKKMVACKILHEGTFLYGNEELFHTVKQMLIRGGIRGKIEKMEKRAKDFRRKAKEYLLGDDPQKAMEENMFLFFPTEESEEFE
ncbi:hypothetical protein ACFL6W_08450 [Thermodesulfobacteriota bacterium]